MGQGSPGEPGEESPRILLVSTIRHCATITKPRGSARPRCIPTYNRLREPRERLVWYPRASSATRWEFEKVAVGGLSYRFSGIRRGITHVFGSLAASAMEIHRDAGKGKEERQR